MPTFKRRVTDPRPARPAPPGSDLLLTVSEIGASGQFECRVDGRGYICLSSAPFRDCARELLARGLDPARRLIMRREGNDLVERMASLLDAAGGQAWLSFHRGPER
jgi:hypothetical protein